MAIVKLPNGRFQVRVRGTDGQWLTRCLRSRAEANVYETQVKRQKQKNASITGRVRRLTVRDYFADWFSNREHGISEGWRREQLRLYRDYVDPTMGGVKVQTVTPQLVGKLLSNIARMGKSAQTRVHVYGLLHKMFADAIESYRILTFNPVLKNLKPKVPLKEAPYLSLNQTRELLSYVVGKRYGLGIWLQLYLGLRIGELQALRWKELDLDSGIVRIHRTYVRKEQVIRDYPKGGRQHSERIPPELLELLKEMKKISVSEFVVTRPDGKMLSYEWYYRTLRRYCRAVGSPMIGTHGLRHSTAGLYLTHGATKEDLRELFAHSSSKVTDRYLHERGTHLEKVTNVVRLFPNSNEMFQCSNVPIKCSNGDDKKGPKPQKCSNFQGPLSTKMFQKMFQSEENCDKEEEEKSGKTRK